MLHARCTLHARCRPSTSFFGNDGISQAVKRLSESSRLVDMSSNPYMGKIKNGDKSGAEVRLTDKDSEVRES